MSLSGQPVTIKLRFPLHFVMDLDSSFDVLVLHHTFFLKFKFCAECKSKLNREQSEIY